MKSRNFQLTSTMKIMSLAFLACLIYWVFDSVMDFLFSDEQFLFLRQHGPMSFWDSFINSISPFDLTERLIIFSVIIITGIIASKFVQGQRKFQYLQFSAQNKFQVLIENLPLLIFQKDIQGKYVFFNELFIKYSNVNPNHVIGKDDVELYGKERGEVFLQEDFDILQHDHAIDHDVKFEYEGEIHYFHIIKTPLHDVDNHVVGIIGIGEDVTAQKQALSEEIRNQKLASLGILAGGLAHDFNNVLMGILGNVELMKMDVVEQSEMGENLAEIHAATLQARQIASQLMNFAKGHKPQKIPTDIVNLIENCAKFVFHGKKSVYTVNTLKEIPLIDLDPNQFSQAVSNILINADQSMPYGGNVTIQITPTIFSADNIYGIKTPEVLEIKISDEGIGIPEQLRTEVFNPYFSTKVSGTGLGLTMTYRIIKNHEGGIKFEPNPKIGTTFTIYLPITQTLKITPIEEEKIIPSFSKKILIMDDDKFVHTSLKKILEKRGGQVTVATNGYEAIDFYQKAKLQKDPFDLVIFDLTIPGSLGGKETFKLLRQEDPNIVGIVSSGYSEDPILAHFREYGFKGVLNKPFTLEELTSVISKVLQELETKVSGSI